MPSFSHQPPRPHTAPAQYARRAVQLFALALCLCAASAGAVAQSGRRAPAQRQPEPQATPTPGGESESGSSPAQSRKGAPVFTFVVYEEEDMSFGAVPYVRRDVFEAFARRLGRSPAVAATRAGRGTRKEARDRAKSEKEAYVVVVRLEEDSMRGSPGQPGDTRSLVIRTYAYAPGTGELKFTDTTWQRPYRQSARIGGIPVPVPGGRMGRYPGELELEQAAREAADRLLSRFNLTPPPGENFSRTP